MVKYRIFFGILMTLLFIAVVLFDGWLDGSLTSDAQAKSCIQGSGIFILIVILCILSNIELAKLIQNKGMKIFQLVTLPCIILLATSWWWLQFISLDAGLVFTFLLSFGLFSVFINQFFYSGTKAVIANCGANCFSILYFGILCSFIMKMRIDFGPIVLLMFVFVVKSADIGAYTIGSIFGKHKFSPSISPKKTWEGMAGAIFLASVVSVLFGQIFGIMNWLTAILFGILFAFIGQLGDLAESMIKRDAEQKDSSSKVPGFGGIMDILDSPLAAAVFAYLFFTVSGV